MSRYHYYAELNQSGMMRLGKIFPDGRAPLRHPNASEILQVGEVKDYFYFVDYEKCSIDQKRMLRGFLSEERHIPSQKIDECLNRLQGLIPLPGCLVSQVLIISPVIHEKDMKRRIFNAFI